MQDIILTYLVNGTPQGIILRTERGHMTEGLKKALLCLTVGVFVILAAIILHLSNIKAEAQEIADIID